MKRAKHATRGKRATRSGSTEHVADALRSVYQRAVDEDIPAEMLDLLSKLD
uniref:NepR family anti-sigma factor n=1 Tax=Sphingobium cloacae TaxID=120107 RepID=UPI001E3348D5|nr:NepR family anti-sigma factor [Sphingobium cloacae]